MWKSNQFDELLGAKARLEAKGYGKKSCADVLRRLKNSKSKELRMVFVVYAVSKEDCDRLRSACLGCFQLTTWRNFRGVPDVCSSGYHKRYFVDSADYIYQLYHGAFPRSLDFFLSSRWGLQRRRK